MSEQATKPKRRPRKQIHDYVEEVIALRVELREEELEINRLKGQRRVGMFERLYQHMKGARK